MSDGLSSNAIVFRQPGSLAVQTVNLTPATEDDLVIDVLSSGISTGTEKMLWNGTMPAFPGLAYPLVPGYEAVGVIRRAGSNCSLNEGETVFVPGASCYQGDLRGLFGASASTLVVPESRVMPVGGLPNNQATLLALAATAMHILTYRVRQLQPGENLHISDIVSSVPQLIVGHGVLGRLLARICVAAGADAPLVCELDALRQQGAIGYDVVSPDAVALSQLAHVVDVSGSCGDHFNRLIAKLGKGGRLTLGGFYSEPVTFDFAPAFMREATIGIAAEWVPDDLSLVLALLQAGVLNFDGLVTHELPINKAQEAYSQAFDDPACLKMIINWSA